jgi:P-type Mg2+ transporter
VYLHADSIGAAFWSLTGEALAGRLRSGPRGLTGEEAARRLRLYGANTLKAERRAGRLLLLLAQFKSPLILILVAAAALSFFLREPVDASIILGIVLLSGLLGFWQEQRAADAVEKLLALVRVEARVVRDGVAVDVPAEEVVTGDLCLLNAGDCIPGDCLILEAKDLFVDEAALTGESFPAEKRACVLPAETPLARRTNSLFMGTHVISGSARALVAQTGAETEFGQVSARLLQRPAETEFERGIRRFGYLLTEVTLILVVLVFAVTVYLERPVFDSFLFSLALAVGLIPELLPAIITVNLAVGAERMARRQVIVKQLSAIENFGSMDVLCADKTGTLTEGSVRLRGALDADGLESERALFYAYLNSSFETSFANPIDEAVRAHREFDLDGYRKADEVPYDFIRKRLSVLVEHGGRHLMVTKGALDNVLEVCSTVELPGGTVAGIDEARARLRRRFEELSAEGLRTLGLAYKDVGAASRIDREDEAGMTFLGLLVFFDPPKEGVRTTLEELGRLGVSLKVITGDNAHVAASVTRGILGHEPELMTGSQLHRMTDDALRSRAERAEVFAEVEPNQKERIIHALRRAGHTVGFLGDGINDAPALHAADVGVSVNTAADVAKEAANIVLLEKDLGVLAEGVREGRRTFANTLKYVYVTTSANFGNMFSMAGAALFLPFLPLLPKQILLNNFLTDFPAMTIAADRVDQEQVERPRRWDIKFIRDFMVVFGLVSSGFDFLTFAALLFVLRATPDEFRTGWFVESVMTELLILLVMRTWKPLHRSRPGRALLASTLLVAAATLALPYTPLGGPLGFTPLPASYLLLLGLITAFYLLASELTKKLFRARFAAAPPVSRAAARLRPAAAREGAGVSRAQLLRTGGAPLPSKRQNL